MKDREQFEFIVKENIKRDGIGRLMKSIKNSDFYIAPASTRYHDSCEGGLVQHSLEVYYHMLKDCRDLFSKETISIVALFHDLCKIGFYKVEMRNTKDATGKWVQVPYYTIDDQLPYGHGEKSVLLIQEYMKLTEEELMAIRWHMGSFDGNDKCLHAAYNKYPLAVYLHCADMKAAYLK